MLLNHNQKIIDEPETLVIVEESSPPVQDSTVTNLNDFFFNKKITFSNISIFIF